jgi:hypothetical protein
MRFLTRLTLLAIVLFVFYNFCKWYERKDAEPALMVDQGPDALVYGAVTRAATGHYWFHCPVGYQAVGFTPEKQLLCEVSK